MDLLLNQRVTVGCFPWRFVDGEASIARMVTFLENRQYQQAMARKAKLPRTKSGDAIGCQGPHPSRATKGSRMRKGRTR